MMAAVSGRTPARTTPFFVSQRRLACPHLFPLPFAGDPKKVAALYAPGAVLLPTLSNVPRTTPEQIQD